MRTVTLIAKGPSAELAKDWAKGDIATVNDSGRYVAGPIAYAFTSDGLSRLEPYRDRIRRIVSPAKAFDLPNWYEPERHIMYADSACEGDRDSLRKRIAEGGICHHHTTTGAMHWLTKVACYDKIRIIGVDGGHAYAANALVNVPAMAHLRTTLGLDFLTEWKAISRQLAALLTDVYGTDVVFYGD